MHIGRFEKPVNAIKWNHQRVCDAMARKRGVHDGRRRSYQLGAGHLVRGQDNAEIAFRCWSRGSVECLLATSLAAGLALGESIVGVRPGWDAEARHAE